MSLESQIKRYVLENFMFTSDETRLKDTDSFLEEGVLDSTGVLELMLFVEESFGISVSDEEVLPENFDSVAQLARYVRQKTEGTPDVGTRVFAD